MINCESAMRLPNTCNVSFRTSLTGAEILAKCPNLLASTAAACHGNQVVSGKIFQVCFFYSNIPMARLKGVLLKSGVSFDLAKSAIRLSVGRETDAQQVEDVVRMLKSAVME